MYYTRVGQFKTNYYEDGAIFPLREDRFILMLVSVVALTLPLYGSAFLLNSVMIPFLIYSLAAIGLNLLTGYTGLLSFGTGAFMGIGAYACYKLTMTFPGVNILVWVLSSGFFAAAVGLVFGIPSLRIKGLYLAVTTLAAQFFLEWAFIRVPWLYNYNLSGAIEVPQRTLFGIAITGPQATPETRYYVVLALVALLSWIASNLVHGWVGRTWMAVRDMDIAAELIGIRLFPSKLLAFAVSSYYCGVAGALLVFFWLGASESTSFTFRISCLVLAMVLLGGLGSIFGSFLGAAFIMGMPIFFRWIPQFAGLSVQPSTIEHLSLMIIGTLIIMFLILEPHGLARLVATAKQKLKVWPFPH